jgi:ATP-dependent Lon protease
VLPIGGVKEKVLAAQRAGLSTVVLPKENDGDLEEVPKDVRRKMTFVFADSIHEVIEAAFDGLPKKLRPAVAPERIAS